MVPPSYDDLLAENERLRQQVAHLQRTCEELHRKLDANGYNGGGCVCGG
jgi:hypothetical protein